MPTTCGIDWASARHDVAIIDETAALLARTRVGNDLAGFTALIGLLAEHGHGAPASIEVAIERDNGLFVAALVAAGVTVVPINPRAAAQLADKGRQQQTSVMSRGISPDLPTACRSNRPTTRSVVPAGV